MQTLESYLKLRLAEPIKMSFIGHFDECRKNVNKYYYLFSIITAYNNKKSLFVTIKYFFERMHFTLSLSINRIYINILYTVHN